MFRRRNFHLPVPVPKTETRPRGVRAAGQLPLYLSAEERDGLRAAGQFNAQLLDFLRPQIRAGVTTLQLDELAHHYTLDHGHIPACLGYKGYPKSICTSVNEVVCHGIPNEVPLQDGDIVNVDLTSIVGGWYGDASETFLIGEVSDEARKLVQVTFDALYVGIDAVKPGGRISDIGRAIYKFARAAGFQVVREYQGHGIGRQFHQDPGVPHYPTSHGSQVMIEPGMCFTVEPMLNIGTWRTVTDRRDQWTVRTTDGKLSAQFEHQLLVTEDGVEILTHSQQGPQRGHQF